jgi:hypothetical protein
MGESESVFATQSHAIQAFTTRRCARDATQGLAADLMRNNSTWFHLKRSCRGGMGMTDRAIPIAARTGQYHGAEV